MLLDPKPGRTCRRCLGGLVLVLLLAAWPLAASAGAPDRAGADEVWTALYLPDGTTLYVRYGEPGGVTIASPPADRDSAAAPAAPVAAEPEGPTTSGAVARRELVRRILREEIGRLRARDAPAERRAPPSHDVSGDYTRTEPLETDRVVIIRGSGEGADTLAAPRDPAASGPAPGDTAAAPDVRLVREQFLSTGLFRTSLVLFETDRAELLAPSREVIRAVGRVLQEFPDARLRVEGHCDQRGPAEYNRRLSLERARTVRNFLEEEMGIDARRLEAAGYGEDRPLVRGTNPTELALNRRVEFRILNPESLQRTID